MNKRLRKKKHVGEFQELGFEVRGVLRLDLDDEDSLGEIDAFEDRLIALVEGRRLAFGGGIVFAGGNLGPDAELVGFITRAGRGSATDEDRAAIARFFADAAIVARHEVRELRDAWNGWAHRRREIGGNIVDHAKLLAEL